MVWLFITFHCIVSNTSCCIFNELLHNRYSGSINNPTKVKTWNFHLWNYRLPGEFPRVILVRNKEEFSWLSNFATSLTSARAECTTALGRKQEKTTLCQGTESYLSPVFGGKSPSVSCSSSVWLAAATVNLLEVALLVIRSWTRCIQMTPIRQWCAQKRGENALVSTSIPEHPGMFRAGAFDQSNLSPCEARKT